jgi:periplasmic protein TonB
MNYRQQGMTASLALHGSALFLLYALSSSFAQTGKPVSIDFSVLEPVGPAHPATPASPPAPRPQQQSVAVRQRPITRTAPVPAQPITARLEPATEDHGAAPILANSRNVLPETPSQPASGTSGTAPGAGTAAGTGSGYAGNPSAEQLRNRYRAEQFAYIKRIIERNLVYPPRAQRMGWTGTCVATFVVQENGQASTISISKSTGHSILDDNVIEAIQRSAPFPRPPVKAELKIPITYRID